MTNSDDRSEHCGIVLLKGLDQDRKTVVEETMSVVDYYEKLHPLIDDSEVRRRRGVRYIQGKVFDCDGKLDQEFENEYDFDGAYKHGRSVHADGTVIDD